MNSDMEKENDDLDLEQFEGSDNYTNKQTSIFLKSTENSCRYDTFFLFIVLVLKMK